MRIQHNIMAMSAYRNYTNNTSAMQKNLERLSSGYKINRAGDDAAGLAISEKMRAQITGLQTAQKNAKDGISLVQTAEGALTEVHDMLNRMVELATQSANGTYEGATDRAQLQKEVDQLREEINRIADSANFNGIKLLDGSMDTEVHNTVSKLTGLTEDLLPAVAKNPDDPEAVNQTVLHTDAKSEDTPIGFSVDLQYVAFTNQTGQEMTITIGDATITLQGESEDNLETDVLTGAALRDKLLATLTTNADGEYEITVNGDKYTVTAGEGSDCRLEFRLVGSTSEFKGAEVKVDGDGVIQRGSEYVENGLSAKETATETVAVTVSIDSASAGDFSAATDSNFSNMLIGNTPNTVKTVTFNVGGTSVTVSIGNGTGAEVSTTDYTEVQAFWDAVIDKANEKIRQKNADAKTAAGENEGATWTEISEITTTDRPKLNGTDATTGQAFGEGTKTTKEIQAGGLTGADLLDHNPNTVEIKVSKDSGVDRPASTTVDLSKLDKNIFKDGGSLTIGKTEYEFTTDKAKLEAGSSGNTKYVDLSQAMDADGNVDLEVIAQMLTDVAGDNSTYNVGYGGSGTSITLEEMMGQEDFDLSDMDGILESLGYKTVTSTTVADGAQALTLQIGDTADSWNQLVVNIRDMHADSLGLGNIDITNQTDAANAIDAIKEAINIVSDVRGTLGATQNRLDHTINNLSVMTENIQDAESTIRDTDIAEEMMAYTKNNILIQSAQAMLAQANQVPQGVLQLLQ